MPLNPLVSCNVGSWIAIMVPLYPIPISFLTAILGGLIVAVVILLPQIFRKKESPNPPAVLLEETTTKLRSTLAYLTAILDNLADGLLVVDRHDRITHYNPALLTMFGLGETNLTNQSYQQIFSCELKQLVDATRHYPSGTAMAEVHLVGNRVGKALATTIRQENLADGSPDEHVGSIVLIRDITPEQELDRLKTDFLSSISHELRTPLTSIVGFSKAVKRKLHEEIFPSLPTDDKKTQRAVRQIGESLDVILAESEKLTNLISTVLDLANIEAGRIAWQMQPLMITEVAEQAIAATAPLAEQKGLQLLQDVEAELPELVGDRDRLIQVVTHLISNGVKFTDKGCVTCQIRKAGDAVRVSIIDTGKGIAQSDCDKIFEKFNQLGDALTEKPQGTGVGLAICERIVERHGGRIWVESKVNQGCTFSFTLPVGLVAKNTTQTIHTDVLVQSLKE